LKAGLGLDSVAVLEFVIALEAEFDCQIDDDEMALRWFATVSAVMELMEKKLSAGGA
jgi:acyl carrier protein